MSTTVTPDAAARRGARRRPAAVSGQSPGARGAAGASRPHVVAFDLIRLVIMVFVVGVHTLAFGGGQVTVVLGAVTTIFHTSRELFFLLTALVLTYNYGHRGQVRWLRFWRRRYWLVVPAYVAWSLIYYAFDGPGRGPFPAAFWHDLLHAGARYHLYFLLVTHAGVPAVPGAALGAAQDRGPPRGAVRGRLRVPAGADRRAAAPPGAAPARLPSG